MAPDTPTIAATIAHLVRMKAPPVMFLAIIPYLKRQGNSMDSWRRRAALVSARRSVARGVSATAVQRHRDGPARHDLDVVVSTVALAVPAPVHADDPGLGLRIAHAGHHAF